MLVILLAAEVSWAWYCLIGTAITVVTGLVMESPGAVPEKPLVFARLPKAEKA
ncbi:MAG: hypothetical protein H7A44_13095 [Opitutaceae bacterium]|nr:hypothetical protein [Opitutaceae bacterium]